MQGFVLGSGTFPVSVINQALDKFSDQAGTNCDKYEHPLFPKDLRRT
jgi:hypothetical protein